MSIVHARHHRYNKALAERVCEKLSSGQSLNTICQDMQMPSRRNIYYWLQTRPEFLQQYLLARELQAEMLAEQIIDLADGVDASDAANLNKVKLQIDVRKWYAAKVAPRKFSDTLLIAAQAMQVDEPLNITPAQAYQRMLSHSSFPVEGNVGKNEDEPTDIEF